ncbi:hypothetical protein M0804_008043 [Polistes exclamans]|nr:hypothetical protein M0804_008043 [Polistes exclamans]
MRSSMNTGRIIPTLGEELKYLIQDILASSAAQYEVKKYTVILVYQILQNLMLLIFGLQYYSKQMHLE